MIKQIPATATTKTLFVGQSTQDPAQTDDFVDDVLALVAQHLPGLCADKCAAVKAAVRDRWGGDRPYIAHRAGEGRSARNEAIRRDFKAGERAEYLARKYNLTRQQIYRVLGM